jgi:hypothetical protein
MPGQLSTYYGWYAWTALDLLWVECLDSSRLIVGGMPGQLDILWVECLDSSRLSVVGMIEQL